MFEIIRNKDGWMVKDNEGNYLNYIENHKVANTCYGNVNGIGVIQDSKITWKKDGRGKISEITWNKIDEMHEYFYKNYTI